MKYNKLKNLLMENKFYDKHDIVKDNLHYIGSGDFGEAYLTKDNKVLKITTSDTEYKYAKDLVNHNKQFPNFVDIYDVGKEDNEYYILQEYLEENSKIEDMYYELSNILEEADSNINELPYFDEDDLKEPPDKKLQKFMDELTNIVSDAIRLTGKHSVDISPDNLGYDKSNKLKLFDIDTRGEL